MRQNFKQGQQLKMKNMRTGDIIDVTVDVITRRMFRVFKGSFVGNLKYYKKLGTYTASEGMTNGKCGDRYILVKEAA